MRLNDRDILRRCRFTPYRRGMGPTFRLVTWYLGGCLIARDRAQTPIGYTLTMHAPDGTRTTLFTAEDFGASPMHAIDSDATVRALMGFLTLRPGDTDAEYFDNYTPDQRAFCDEHAETLSACYWRGKMLTGD